jgi:hypothetical protein
MTAWRRAGDATGRWLATGWRLLRPTLPHVLRVNARRVAEPEPFTDVRDLWTANLRRRTAVRSAAAILYQESLDRFSGLEAKAVGVLQAGSIAAAGALLACSDPAVVPRTLGIIALAYLFLAAGACGAVLIPRPRYVLSPDELLSPTAGHAEMIAAVVASTPLAIRMSNLVTSAVCDLARGAAVTGLALLVVAVF